MDKILLMLQLQNQLNEATNGYKWTDGITKNGKTINWRRCIYMECAEMVDSFSWKHWKSLDKEPDWDNHQIEVVDVWHFIMSLAIEEYSKNLRGGVEDLGISIAQYLNFDAIDTNKENFAKQEDVIEQVENIIRLSINDGELNLEILIADFFNLVIMSGLNLDTLYKLYIGKNVLNQFRQDHGYKDGTYIKIWNGEEDNVVMKRVWEDDSNIKPDNLYKELAKVYLSLKA
ncbi:dUTP diphosphatase [Sulfurimonas sp.]|jgi:dimeric dUTPase (all-alpha-NTP-PPase superfamily)|uniref:dUTP diphosphatase n=1 Tax=Sulfurimonas sp. TaxID=2022749 RepID=UPI0025D8F6BD|nr:dUTP diphosphatase [Sulfurimonas sp.]MBT5935310.1 dUTPase [Sulfurimonas sp.]